MNEFNTLKGYDYVTFFDFKKSFKSSIHIKDVKIPKAYLVTLATIKNSCRRPRLTKPGAKTSVFKLCCSYLFAGFSHEFSSLPPSYCGRWP